MTNEEMLTANADVEIIIEGLALCCFNPTDQAWQIELPQDTTHQLEIVVEKMDKFSGTAREIFKVAKGELGDGNKRGIKVSGNEVSWTNTNKAHYQGSDFSWEVEPEGFQRNDFRYIIDMEDKNLVHEKVEPITDPIDSFRLTLEHCFLYTFDLSEVPYILFDDKRNDTNEKYLHRVGKFIGGKIFMDSSESDASLSLKMKGSFNESLADFDKFSYRITFDNDCPHKKNADKMLINCSDSKSFKTQEEKEMCEADFITYYQLVEPTDTRDKRRFTLRHHVSPQKADEPIFGRIDCDPAWLSKTTKLF